MSQSFTLQYDGLSRTIITHCGISSPFDPLNQEATPPPVSHYDALWDTGASGTVITSKIAQELGLAPSGKSKVYHANGESTVNTYFVNLYLPNQVGFPFVKVTEGVLNGFDILIGMDIINAGDFSISNFEGKTTFSFRVPSSKTVDYVKEHNTPVVSGKVGRNSPCPCGSGKKHKNCHGK